MEFSRSLVPFCARGIFALPQNINLSTTCCAKQVTTKMYSSGQRSCLYSSHYTFRFEFYLPEFWPYHAILNYSIFIYKQLIKTI